MFKWLLGETDYNRKPKNPFAAPDREQIKYREKCIFNNINHGACSGVIYRYEHMCGLHENDICDKCDPHQKRNDKQVWDEYL